MADRSRTPAQIAASRANGRKSTGPKTPVGKSRSRLNAVRHGLRATTLAPLLATDKATSETLRLAVRERFRPADSVERELADALAGALWRLRRAGVVESELFGDAPGRGRRGRRAAAVKAFAGDGDRGLALTLLLRYRTQAQNELARLLRLMTELHRSPDPAPPPPAAKPAAKPANDNTPGLAGAAQPVE